MRQLRMREWSGSRVRQLRMREWSGSRVRQWSHMVNNLVIVTSRPDGTLRTRTFKNTQ